MDTTRGTTEDEEGQNSSLKGPELDESRDEDEGECGIYLPYNPVTFSLQHFFRPQNDIVASYIVQSGMEGIDRYEISRNLGINANCKPGNRIVSASIHATLRSEPKLFGEYQKMEGRFRVKKYYVKGAESAPGGELLKECMVRFKELTGRDCPFKLGDVLKFPGQNINTLRISDISLKRLVRILEFVHQQKVVITHQKIGQFLTAREQEEGYKFTIDRKSVRKLLLALVKHRLLNLLELEKMEEEQKNKVEAITVPEIKNTDHPLVLDALQKIHVEFKEANKSFPTGHQLKREPVDEPEAATTTTTASGRRKRPAPHEPEDRGRRLNGVKQEPEEEEEAEGSGYQHMDGSLLDQTFTSLERMQNIQKYGRKGASHLSILSSKSLNSLVESAKRRKLARVQRRPRTVKEEPEEDQQAHELEEGCSSTEATVKAKKRKRVHGYASRTVDNVDRISLQHKAYLRSRFSQIERDMLLLIRACSFFLNPVSRFWPHPKVLRNLMHEFVPESRTKTTYSLMAAGVRELKDRQPQHRYIVKTLASYPELLELRNKLATLDLSQKAVDSDETLPQKDQFFMDSFRLAYQLLFKETLDFPSIHASDLDFQRYMRTNGLHFVHVAETEKSEGTSYSGQSKRPVDQAAIRPAVAYNAVMCVMHYEDLKMGSRTDGEGEEGASKVAAPNATDVSNFLLSQIEIQTLGETLEKLRADGLITKNRTFGAAKAEAMEEAGKQGKAGEMGEEQQLPTATTRKIRLTQFYKHYFDSDFHRNLTNNIVGTASKFMQPDTDEERNFGNLEDPGEFAILADRLCDGKSIAFTVPNSLGELFVQQKKTEDEEEDEEGPSTSMARKSAAGEDILNFTGSTKQLRYLENSELCLERLQIQPDEQAFGRTFSSTLDGMPEPSELVARMERLVMAQKMPPPAGSGPKNGKGKKRPDAVDEPMPSEMEGQDGSQRQIFEAIDQAGPLGIAEEELMSKGICSTPEELHTRLDALLDSSDIFAAGIDKRCYVSSRNGRDWLMRTSEGHGFVARPWSMPWGATNWKVLSWMLEGLLFFICANPGLSLNQLHARFSTVLQPIFIQELLELLQKLGCCQIHSERVQSLRKNSPFEDSTQTEMLKFVQPCPHGMERLVLFNNFKLSTLNNGPNMNSNCS